MVHYDKSTSGVDTVINYTHIGLFATTLFAIGVAYGTVNAKIDKLLTLVAQYEQLDKRTVVIERTIQGQDYINKNYDERFLRDEDKIKNFTEQRPISKYRN